MSLVTGGASGLGRATVEHFSRLGASVAVLDLQASRAADLVNDRVLVVAGDVCNPEDVRKVVAAAKDRWGMLTNAVHCAGQASAHQTYNFYRQRPHTLEEFKHLVHQRVTGVYNVVSACAKEMDATRGNIVLCMGHWALREGDLGQAALAAGDGAALGLLRALQQSLQEVHVSAVVVGMFSTPLLQYMPPKVLEYLSRQVPLPSRLGSPSEFAHLAARVVTSRSLSGRLLRLDGALRLSPL